MTHRIAHLVVAAVICLLIAVSITPVSAEDPPGGVVSRSGVALNTTPVHIIAANGIAQEHFEAMTVAQPDLFALPASLTQTQDDRAMICVSDSYCYVRAPGGMWAIIHYWADGVPVVEDYVSGPFPLYGSVDAKSQVGQLPVEK